MTAFGLSGVLRPWARRPTFRTTIAARHTLGRSVSRHSSRPLKQLLDYLVGAQQNRLERSL
jgi:hypothetical protein